MKDKSLLKIILNGICLAMSIATLVLNILNKVTINESIVMLSIGLLAISLNQLNNK